MNLFDKIQSASKYIKQHCADQPKIGIILGSGLGGLADRAEQAVTLSYDKIPHFKTVKILGHAGELVLGKIAGKTAAILKGRYHYYEGHAMQDVVFPARVLAHLGIKQLILTNAAGGVNRVFQPGDLMVITDHINLMGNNPLRAENDERLGPRFPDMSRVYDPQLCGILLAALKNNGLKEHSGIYAALSGPSYETPAEIKMLRTLGADAVGMSTVPEAIASRHMGVRVCGISCITNMAAGILDQTLNHKEVEETAIRVKEEFIKVLLEAVSNMD